MIETKPRRVRIVEKNMRGYTGYIGGVMFTDGVSDEPLSYPEYMKIGANISIVDWEAKSDKSLLTPAAESIANGKLTITDKRVASFNDGTVFDTSRYERPVVRTREELESIAAKEGLPGIREIARIWGGTGRSISDCISSIMSAQDKFLAAEKRENAAKKAEESSVNTEESEVKEAAETIDEPDTAQEDIDRSEEKEETHEGTSESHSE